MHALWQDARHALRALGASPGYAVTVILTMAVALGLNVTMFTVVNAYMLRPLPVREPERLFQLSWSTAAGGGKFFSQKDADAFRAAGAPYSDALSYEPFAAAFGGQ